MSTKAPRRTLTSVSNLVILLLLLLIFASNFQFSHEFESGQYFSTKPEVRFLSGSEDGVHIRLAVSNSKSVVLQLTRQPKDEQTNTNNNNLTKSQHRRPASPPNNECEYIGNVLSSTTLPSLASISLCGGLLNGMFEADGKVYRIKQTPGDSRVRVALQGSQTLHCGVADGDTDGGSLISRWKRDLRPHYYNSRASSSSIFNRTRYVELVVVNDHGIYLKYGKNVDFINERTKQIINIVNSLYMPLNIHIVLKAVVIWTEKNEIPISADSSEMLNSFLKYRKEVLMEQFPNDNAQLITSKSFDSGIVGKALKSTMCTLDYSSGVNSDYSESISPVATTIAHELGHNFGMEHDHSDCECPDKTCIMGPSSSFPMPTNWSSCSVDQLINGFKHGIDACLFNKPTTVFRPSCGNGIVDAGEQCDCGLEKSCTNPCCDAKTCKFRTGAKCANGECCNLSTCQIMTSDTVCRSARGVCDIEEKCPGDSEICPDDSVVKDGTECNPGYAFCARGECRDREQQCQLLWGDTSQVGEYRCYQHNLNATSSGNCGYNQKTKKFIPCETLKDSICGRLHCSHPAPEKLKYGPEGAATISVSKEVRRGKVIQCNSVMIDIGLEQPDPGLVPDGAKCGANAMCWQQKCVPTSRFLQEKSCPYNCHGNGQCDQEGYCHCYPGFSSHDCSSQIGRILTISVYVFFFGILPLAVVFVTLKLCKVNIKNWFSRSHFGKQKNYHDSTKKTFSAPVGKGDISMPLQALGKQSSTNFPASQMVSLDLMAPPPLPKSAPVASLHHNQNHHLQPIRPAPPIPSALARAQARPESPAKPPPVVAVKPQLKPMTSLGSSNGSSTTSTNSTSSRPANPPPPPPPVGKADEGMPRLLPTRGQSPAFDNETFDKQDEKQQVTAMFGVSLKPVGKLAPPPPVPPHKPNLNQKR